jgi:hypothetical protein
MVHNLPTVNFSIHRSQALVHTLLLSARLKVRNIRLGRNNGEFTIMVITVNPNSTVFEPENACEQVIYSGGGFSNYFSIPDYQKHAVQCYLKDYPPPYSKSTYNSTGKSRAYPDLSANGANYAVPVSQSCRDPTTIRKCL